LQFMVFARSAALALVASYALYNQQNAECWLYRDDIGAFWGIKGYEEQVSEVGTHHGHLKWPQYQFMGTYDSGSVRRGMPYPSFRLPSFYEEL
jgi:hypothetical protein